MVDRDIANAITIAMIANVIEVTVILFITFFSFIGESIRLVFPDFGCAGQRVIHLLQGSLRIRHVHVAGESLFVR